jgi:hypothetical protein
MKLLLVMAATFFEALGTWLLSHSAVVWAFEEYLPASAPQAAQVARMHLDTVASLVAGCVCAALGALAFWQVLRRP